MANTSQANMSSSPFTVDIQIGVSVFASLLFLVSLIGNIVVIYIVCTRAHMRNSTNILIANMAIGDLLLTIDIPYIIKWLFVFHAWFGSNFFADFLCKFFHSVQMGSIACSVFTLVAISFDRCFAITYPLRKVLVGKVLKATIAGIWLFSLSFCTPLIIVTQARASHGHSICAEFWDDFPSINHRYFIVAFSICTYIMPLVLIAVVYLITGIRLWQRKLPGNENLLAKEKVHATSRKATIMLVTVVLVFAICWLPLQVREVLKFYEAPFEVPIKVDIILPWIGFSNIAINPILYIIFSENYRSEFLSILCCKQIKKHSFYNASPMSTPMISRAMTERSRLSPSPDVNRHLLSPSSIQLKPLKNGPLPE
ncbi:RYamide receptor [Exaiptasia diaphana]|uniref:G-protein coupled receptors family 1 profile domain-containing protein n=1 Tax=Exaiptasia diaphana TaxID=2652724 RepID=A0A913XGS1_EXADI|nr:RYamide receptor [Exaiptasia diaphana]XP_020904145.1 RYamide receptor [Exaiptasia diaphana]